MTYTMNVGNSDGSVKQFVHRDIVPERLAEDKAYVDILQRVGPYTMTIANGAGATYNLFKSVKYIVENRIAGAIAECGVWRGGSMMLIASALMHFGDQTRELYLYDTYSGMTEPDDRDVDNEGRKLKEIWNAARQAGGTIGYGGSLADVQANLHLTGYPASLTKFVEGDVAATIPATAPREIALLRLDTDFYKSTLHELTHLYHRVTAGGVVYIDDYGWCEGAREATDEFVATLEFKPLLVRVDEGVRLLVKV
jgi:hypothetical protein